MFLQPPGDRQRHGGVTLDEAREGDVLQGVVEAVRIVAEVLHDVEAQRVVGLLAGVEGSELALDQVEQAGRVARRSRAPYRDRLRVMPSRLAVTLRGTLTRIKVRGRGPVWTPLAGSIVSRRATTNQRRFNE